MKTTKKWSKMLLAGMAAVVLAFGLVLVGCDDGKDNGGGGGGGAYDGTYINATETIKIILSGNNFRMTGIIGGSWVDGYKGTFEVSGTIITFTSTHEYDGTGLAPVSPPIIGHKTISSDGRTITDGGDTYTKQ